ncbi:Uu.00g047100.m01.CDS01 [Anthostomella pinea]|uniref:Uu.00g047100.m01.CDS01 n=1 Tax=Anthostomella pinea TaxID=933095 RepID=A0AAI8YEK3_9PEZI|nr:Uu.00g047100.m01.CDS01 [Anthostomella pinea]
MSDGESDDGKRSSKKRKASRACDRCNSQHQPCDNATPKCSVCVRAGTDCTYNRPVRKRGPRSGYTGQNGERLWAVVLQAKPELEDLVLQVLRGGTYRDTGVSNLDFYRNNDNQTELVNSFNESRLGRFLQNGESPDLLLPPVDNEVPAVPCHGHGGSEAAFGQPTNAVHQPQSTSYALNGQNKSMSPVSAPHSGIVNPHGAPQHPGDIYLQSEDIRRGVFSQPQGQGYGYESSASQRMPHDRAVDRSSVLTVPQSAAFGSNGSIEEYGEQGHRIVDYRIPERRSSFNYSADAPQQSYEPILATSIPIEQQAFDFGLADTSRWLDSIPTDTLLNLGFIPGEGMAEDFLELCENPDPIDSTPGASADQHEDEEAVWRRLVMRGRFI